MKHGLMVTGVQTVRTVVSSEASVVASPFGPTCVLLRRDIATSSRRGIHLDRHCYGIFGDRRALLIGE